ncbi:hypothetical protein [Paenibacillus rigui]|uniref:hypothetical protein n=1 Tax=Paenibacillus rigui TaxID=554312 RepID=UPI0015C5B61B|nr:hypothetical protein [Paenibacillus rigui]
MNSICIFAAMALVVEGVTGEKSGGFIGGVNAGTFITQLKQTRKDEEVHRELS